MKLKFNSNGANGLNAKIQFNFSGDTQVAAFLDFIRDSELVIHNAEFDVGFLEHELTLMHHARPRPS